jgi:ketosteroid isomerase-like protein
MATTQSSQEVINHHAQALSAEDLEEIVADYSDDAVFIGSGRRPAWQGRHPPSGHQAPQRGAAGHRDIESLSTRTTSCCLSGDAEGGGIRIEDGIDTFVFRDGLIRVQTASATAAARSLTGGKCHAPGC